MSIFAFIIRFLLVCLIFVFCGCHSKESHARIGRDLCWTPLDFGNQTANINAFTNALISAINQEQHTHWLLVDTNWEDLSQNLDHQKIAGMLHSVPLNLQNQDRYDFSDPFLSLGPVLIVRQDQEIISLEGLKNKILGVYQYDQSVLIAQKYPSILIQLYQNIPQALEQLAQGTFDGLLVPSLQAQALVPHLYDKTLKIVTKELNDDGLRLVTLKNMHPHLIEQFNHGLQSQKQTGHYAQLRAKYGVS